MGVSTRVARLLVGVLVTAAYPLGAAAQPAYQVMHAFVRPPEEPAGRPIEVQPGIFAVPMRRGGARDLGAILRFDRQADGSLTSTILHEFSGPDGATPGRLMRGIDGALYGTTARGGATDEGTAFRLTLDGDFATLHSFSGDAAFPNLLMLRTADGTFYGTLGGSEAVIGKVFSLTPAGAVAIVPIAIGASLQDVRLAETAGGDIYGVWNTTFFRLTETGDTILLRDLSSAGYSGSTYPVLIAGRDGNFYVNLIDIRNLPDAPDVILRLTPDGAFSTVRAFPTQINITDLIEASDGHFYGASTQPTAIFRVTKAGAFTTLHTFSWWDGYQPIALMQASDGHLLGVTIGGGLSNRGTLFEISAAGVAIRGHFSDPAPLNPVGTLTRGADGALYGTSCGGGDYNSGTVFKVTEAGVLTVVHAFRYWDGICPTSGLTRTSDGTLWGTARASLIGQGTIFKISAAGVFSLIHILTSSEGQRPVALLIASDGNLYGTTTQGGPTSQTFGSVFRVTPAGVFTVLHRFGGTGLRHPWAGLAQGADGAIYGTTVSGSESSGGVFRLTLAGGYTEFPWHGPVFWPMRLVPSPSGGFFGSTAIAEVFTLTSLDVPVVLHALSGADGSRPIGDLTLAGDGRLYGTAWEGGTANVGTVFRVTTAGAFEKLHDFSGLDGANPFAGLLETASGVFFGSSAVGGPGNGGVIFRLSVK